MSNVSAWDVVAASASGFTDEQHIRVLGRAIRTLSQRQFPNIPVSEWPLSLSESPYGRERDSTIHEEGAERISRPSFSIGCTSKDKPTGHGRG